MAEPDTMRFTGSNAGLVVSAEPYENAANQKAVFDQVLTDADYLPIQIRVENRSDGIVFGRPHKFELDLAGGQAVRPAPASEVAQELFGSGGVMVSTFLFGGLGLLVAGNAEDTARQARADDYGGKTVQHLHLEPGQSAGGFLYFPFSGTPASQVSAKLVVRLTRALDSVVIPVEVPITLHIPTAD